jgi:serine/threonine protein kinase
MVDKPTLIGRYIVDRELGSGGMGEVYLAYSPAGDPVAVKLIRSDRLDPVTRARFEKEALIARTVVGTNRVARFLDADPYADRPWLAMEYVPGETLTGHVESHGPLPTPLVASLGALLAEGLEVVHAAGLLHRDIKPQNVIMGEYGPVLIDFGLGAFLNAAAPDTLSHSGMIIGTVRYMPPEQATGNVQVTPAADVYGLGAVLLFAATRHHPYDGVRWEAIAGQVADPHQAPDLGDLSAPLAPLIGAMLAHDPGHRPSLPEVTSLCTAVLAEQRTSAVHARHALISRTGSVPGVPTPSHDPVPRFEPNDDALDAGPEATTDLEDEPPAPIVGGRPASHRVAEELRRRYAARAGL